jgi:hypothetical protein
MVIWGNGRKAIPTTSVRHLVAEGAELDAKSNIPRDSIGGSQIEQTGNRRIAHDFHSGQLDVLHGMQQ